MDAPSCYSKFRVVFGNSIEVDEGDQIAFSRALKMKIAAERSMESSHHEMLLQAFQIRMN